MPVIVEFLHPKANFDHVGEIPEWLSEQDPDSARQQLHKHYGHGGGWQPMSNFTMRGTTLLYPNDPPFEAIAKMQLRDEIILVYDHSIIAIVQRDGAFECARMN